MQDHIETFRPVDRVRIVSSVQQATNEADHTAHDYFIAELIAENSHNTQNAVHKYTAHTHTHINRQTNEQ